MSRSRTDNILKYCYEVSAWLSFYVFSILLSTVVFAVNTLRLNFPYLIQTHAESVFDTAFEA